MPLLKQPKMQAKEKNVPVFFEKENINTMDSKGEVLLTIMASLAQQESESLSKNVKMGLQFRYQNGEVQVNHNWFLGYTKDENGHLIIDEEQAVVVRRIFREYLQGSSLKNIADGLMADGIPTATGNMKWRSDGIRKILTNEKYMGDALLQKTYTVSILEKKRAENNGQLPKYYVEGSHEAIIDKDVFLKVQAEMSRRANLNPGGKKRVYNSKYALSGMVFCGHCGDIYRRIYWNNHGKKSTVWRCVSRVLKKSSGIDCPARTVWEVELHDAIVTAINDAYAQRHTVIPILKENIKAVINDDLEEKIIVIDKRLELLQQQLINESGDELAVENLGMKIVDLREERQQILMEIAERNDMKTRIQEMADYLDTLPTAIIEYDETLTRRLVEKVTIFDEKIVVTLKSGMEMEVEA